MAKQDTKTQTITLPICESNYECFMKDKSLARQILDDLYEKQPELFPMSLSLGYKLNGKTRKSKKELGFQMRKISVQGFNYQIRPSFMLPYCRAKSDVVSKGLFLLRFGVPFWALAFVFGYNTTWWYRMFIFLSHYNLVGTTVYESDDLPKHVLADEHHIKVKAEKKYVATTVGENCFLGMSVCDTASEADLKEGYKVFKEESQSVKSDYEPISVNTDGWLATQNAWNELFDSVETIECFLHAYLKIRDRATKKVKADFKIAGDKIWNIYEATTKRQVAQRIRRLREWAKQNMTDCPMKQNILKLCAKKNKWLKHIDNPNAYRTSNMLDRLMRNMKKHKINSQSFHSDKEATTKNFRAFAFIYNFSPSCPEVWKNDNLLKSPAARLNKKIYADNWLENLVLSASRHLCRQHSKM